jgi:hypothetical protein
MKPSLTPLDKVKMKPKPELKVIYEVLSLAFPKSIFRTFWQVGNPGIYESSTWLKARIPLSIRSLSTGV